MGEEPGTARASVTDDAPKDPEQIREEIEATRQELGDTVEALAAKADVKARMREKIGATKESAAEKIGATKESAAEKLGKARESSPDNVSSAAAQATTTAKQNPIPLAAAGVFIVGFLAGRLTRR